MVSAASGTGGRGRQHISRRASPPGAGGGAVGGGGLDGGVLRLGPLIGDPCAAIDGGGAYRSDGGGSLGHALARFGAPAGYEAANGGGGGRGRKGASGKPMLLPNGALAPGAGCPHPHAYSRYPQQHQNHHYHQRHGGKNGGGGGVSGGKGPVGSQAVAWLEAAAASAAALSIPPPPPPLAPAPVRRAASTWLETGGSCLPEQGGQRRSCAILSTNAPGQDSGEKARSQYYKETSASTSTVASTAVNSGGAQARRPSDGSSEGWQQDSADAWESTAHGLRRPWPDTKDEHSDEDESEGQRNEAVVDRLADFKAAAAKTQSEAIFLSLSCNKRKRQEYLRLIQERREAGGLFDDDIDEGDAQQAAVSSPTATTETPDSSGAELAANSVADETLAEGTIASTAAEDEEGPESSSDRSNAKGTNPHIGAGNLTPAGGASAGSKAAALRPQCREGQETASDERPLYPRQQRWRPVVRKTEESDAAEPTSAAAASASDGAASVPEAVAAASPKSLAAQDKDATGGGDGKAANTGSALLRLLKGGGKVNGQGTADGDEQDGTGEELLKLIRCGGGAGKADLRADGMCETSAGAYPMSLLEEPWEPLVRPIVDFAHAKAFVGTEVFGKRNGGLSVADTGSRPQVLVDIPDKGLMIMFKPSGWATCSTPHWEGNEGNLIRHVWKTLNAPTAAPCHRLDKGTSGIVVVATNKNSSKHICQQICAKSLVKQYVGLCHGRIVPTAGAFSGPLALSHTDKPLGTCYNEGREAVTRFRVLGYFQDSNAKFFSLVQVQIDHGRQHQIRLHMASLGHPLVHDAKYNSSCLREDSEICGRLFLHACYLRCMLPPDEEGNEEPFSIACRLPAELKHTLTQVLTWRKSETEGPAPPGEEPLPALFPEAQRLCECLLASENRASSGNADSLRASRLAIRKRDEFLHRFGFNGAEKAEITRILAKLPTAKERSSALQQFRVLGQRTPDFIVARFAKYVEGLLRWRKQPMVGSDDETDEEPAPVAAAAEEEEAEESAVEAAPSAPSPEPSESAAEESGGEPVDPVGQVTGPVRIHAETIWCEVCGFEERIVSLEVPGLSLRIRAPVADKALPDCFHKLAWACDGWDEEEDDDGYGYHTTARSSGLTVKKRAREEERRKAAEREAAAAGYVPSGKEKKRQGKNEQKDVDQDLDDDSEEVSTYGGKGSKGKGGGKKLSAAEVEARERDRHEEELQQVVRDYVEEQGGSVDGVWVAGKVAARFNQWIRTNSKRNDGSLRRWIAAVPGVTVEHCGKNRWRVHSL